MNNHQLKETGTKIAIHLLAVIAGVVLILIGLLFSIPMIPSPGHPDRSGWSAHLPLGPVRHLDTEARDSAIRQFLTIDNWPLTAADD